MERYKLPCFELILKPNVLRIMQSFIQDGSKKHQSDGILLGQIKDGGI